MSNSAARNYPGKPIRMLAGFPLGVSSDTAARMVSQKLSDYSGQSAIVENRPGAAGQLATERLLQTPPDGYTLMMITAAEISYSTVTAVLPMPDSGRLRPLTNTSLKRSPPMPRTPTVDESGLRGYECVGWFGLVAPAAASRDVIENFNALIIKAGPELAPQMGRHGLDIKTNAPQQFAAMMRNEIEQNTKLIRAAGIRLE